MKTIIKISTALLIVVTFISCGPSYMVVRERPVAPYYARPIAPGPGYVWIDGDWYLRGGRYQYRNGYWAVPHARRTYAPGYWHQSPRRGYTWRRGRWH